MYHMHSVTRQYRLFYVENSKCTTSIFMLYFKLENHNVKYISKRRSERVKKKKGNIIKMQMASRRVRAIRERVGEGGEIVGGKGGKFTLPLIPW